MIVRPLMLGVLLLCQPACQAQPPVTTPSRSRVASVSEPKTPTARVLARLEQLPRADPVLGALTAEQRSHFDRLLDSLSDDERQLLRAADNPIVFERPLLHLMAGGRAQRAFLVLATTNAAARELGATLPGGPERVLSTTNQVIERAAHEWLRLAREHLERDSKLDPSFCDHLDRVAGTLGDGELRRAARELWVQIEDSPAARLNLARAALWTGDLVAAREQHRMATAGPELTDRLQEYAAQIEELLELAERASVPPASVDEAVERARSYLRLHDSKEATQVLEPFHTRPHLGVATMRVVSAYPELPCPGVRGGLGDARLCAFAMRQDLFQSRLFAELDRAWRSKQGRSEESVQDYLGLSVVLPWRSGLAGRQATASVSEYAKRLAEVSAEAVALSPRFAGLELFGRAVAAGAEARARAEPGAVPRLPAEQRQELFDQARSLARSGAASDTVATLLGVAAVLSQQLDVRDLYQLIGSSDTPRLAVSQVALGAWLAAAWTDPVLFESVKAQGISVLQRLDERSLASSSLVALLAEAANVIEPTPGNRDTLKQVSTGLSRAQGADELRLRGALQLVQLTSGTEQETALEQLRRLSEATRAPAGSTLALLKALSRARLVLADVALRPRTQQTAGAQLSALRRAVEGQALPPGIAGWYREWEAELVFRESQLRCARQAACVARARRQQQETSKQISEAVGPVTAQLMARGVLTLGTLEMSMDYLPGAGLQPVVLMEPALLFLPMPGTASHS